MQEPDQVTRAAARFENGKPGLTLVVLVLVGLSVGACGRRGALEAAPGTAGALTPAPNANQIVPGPAAIPGSAPTLGLSKKLVAPSNQVQFDASGRPVLDTSGARGGNMGGAASAGPNAAGLDAPGLVAPKRKFFLDWLL